VYVLFALAVLVLGRCHRARHSLFLRRALFREGSAPTPSAPTAIVRANAAAMIRVTSRLGRDIDASWHANRTRRRLVDQPQPASMA
jgi:hypothetical protein